jgi:hypothetical protein
MSSTTEEVRAELLDTDLEQVTAGKETGVGNNLPYRGGWIQNGDRAPILDVYGGRLR